MSKTHSATKDRNLIRSIVKSVCSKNQGMIMEDGSVRWCSVGAELQKKPPRKLCKHIGLDLYFKPCLDCDTFCNCRYSDFPPEYPDVLVRSRDKEIVRLSKDLVRSSTVLATLVDDVLGRSKPENGVVVNPPKNAEINQEVLIKTGYICGSISVGMGHGNTENDGVNYVPPRKKKTPAEELKEKVRRANGDGDLGEEWEDIIDLKDRDGLLVLFDTDSSRPTVGISKKALLKVDRFICMHLEEVDSRVASLRRLEAYFGTRENRYDQDMCLDDDNTLINTFAFEDWEEEFFKNISSGEFFELHQANQELLIWDLYYALEKWIFLFRGAPARMMNGWYDHTKDPDFENFDNRTLYGLYGINYKNPRRRCYHKIHHRFSKVSDYNRDDFKAIWFTPK